MYYDNPNVGSMGRTGGEVYEPAPITHHEMLMGRVEKMRKAELLTVCVAAKDPNEAYELLEEYASWHGISYGKTPHESSDLDTDLEAIIEAIMEAA